MLYDSLHGKLLTLPDSVKVYPAHGAGSLCGRNISSETSSTIGRAAPVQLRAAADAARGIRPPGDDGSARGAGVLLARCALNRRGAGRLAESPPPPGAVARPRSRRRSRAGAILLDTPARRRVRRRARPGLAAHRSLGSVRVVGRHAAVAAGTRSCSWPRTPSDVAEARRAWRAWASRTSPGISRAACGRGRPPAGRSRAPSRSTWTSSASACARTRTSSSPTCGGPRSGTRATSRGAVSMPLHRLAELAAGARPDPAGRGDLRRRLPVVDRARAFSSASVSTASPTSSAAWPPGPTRSTRWKRSEP